ncbi:uracil-DNA glycosylase [Patescibacteria group bacterium]|nr:uracil-DNA glycosylase [Patescibacteria group bacterium]
MHIRLEESWKQALASELETEYFKELTVFVREAYLNGTVYPPPKDLFAAFDDCQFDQVKVVILGQDPYHSPEQAHGLAFSVPDGVAIPPSLKNIYKEIKNDIGTDIPPSGNLERWADQGVFLLNSTLTVAAGAPGSHQGKGWEEWTDAAVKALSEEREHLVFLLWGNFAKKKGAHIDRTKHLVLEAAHPSPLGAYKGFFGSRHFSKTNAYLEAQGQKPIVW